MTAKHYKGYTIEFIFDHAYLDYSFEVKDFDDKIVLRSNVTYDSVNDAYDRACIRIDELK